MELSTERLRLIALDLPALRQYFEDPLTLEDSLGLCPGAGLSHVMFSPAIQQAIRIKLMKMGGAPRAEFAWYTFWLIVVRVDQVGVGLVGFKGAPDRYGSVELGYEIDPNWQRRGLMTEAVGALIDWAFMDQRCLRVTAETRPDNQASIRVLEKNGLSLAGSRAGMVYWALERSAWKPGPDGG